MRIRSRNAAIKSSVRRVATDRKLRDELWRILSLPPLRISARIKNMQIKTSKQFKLNQLDDPGIERHSKPPGWYIDLRLFAAALIVFGFISGSVLTVVLFR